jgi:hypothetical protein
MRQRRKSNQNNTNTNEERPWYRKAGHALHRSMGCVVLLIAWWTCGTGLQLKHGYSGSAVSFHWWIAPLVIVGMGLDKCCHFHHQNGLRRSEHQPQEEQDAENGLVQNEQSPLIASRSKSAIDTWGRCHCSS